MIIVTGTEGFIGSVLVEKLLVRGYKDLVCVDLENVERNQYISEDPHIRNINHRELFDFIEDKHLFIEFIFHLGACSDTTQTDKRIFDELNLNYSKQLWNSCVKYGIPMLYASSAATYGNGVHGYSDDHALIPELKPLNLYGQSKQDFDMWALQQEVQPLFWAGLKFFNVYGRNEIHKNSMASVVLHSFNQIQKQGYVNLFRSHRDDVKDGDQSRDFIYVDDVCDVMLFYMEQMPESGIFNVGTGINRTFSDLVRATFKALGLPAKIKYVDTPLKLRGQYQYYTRADISKLRSAGYSAPFTTLESGVADYVKHYLMNEARVAV
ncbi:ADP-glyceromanno-heptose 6-epimerase [Saccharicrinis sp. FJH54]|uniref:ADP-glyceromanno-heptose 6-epimerase n=1 Tax=Saccharicrinis sp. FJH54 TaxID=3344665 RepID=UPI0035D3EBBB